MIPSLKLISMVDDVREVIKDAVHDNVFNAFNCEHICKQLLSNKLPQVLEAFNSEAKWV